MLLHFRSKNLELYSRRTEGTANIWIWFQIFQEWLLCWYIIINEMKRIWTSFMNLFCFIYLAVSIFCNFHVIVQVIHLHTVLPTSISFAICRQSVFEIIFKICYLLFVLVLVHNYHSWVKVCPREAWTIYIMMPMKAFHCHSFYSEGTRETPSHRFSDFKFKTYSPVAFR